MNQGFIKYKGKIIIIGRFKQVLIIEKINNMSTTNILKKRLKVLKNESDSLIKEIDKRTDAKKMPSLKKKFEGKYFKFENTNGNHDEWFTYFYCHRVKNSTTLICDKLEITPLKKVIFQIKSDVFIISISGYMKPTMITQIEYYQAVDRLFKSANQIDLRQGKALVSLPKTKVSKANKKNNKK